MVSDTAPRTAAIVNLGCKVNQSEVDAAARLLRSRGVAVVGSHDTADLILVNTCTVTAEADAKSRSAVRRARRENPNATVIVTGCSVYCTYCIIPTARGPERSLRPEKVLADVRRALAAGHREVVLTGINIGTYDGGWSERGPRGSHRAAALTLAGLIRRLLDETDVERIRLSSIEPQHVDEDLLAAWQGSNGRCLPHFHLPLQSGDDGVLHRMGRRYDSAGYAATVARVRAAVPGVAIHGDVIVGFPTEDDAAWERSLAFIREIGFAGIHIFRYSARPGTAAVRMASAVDEGTKKRRAAELLAVAAEGRAAFAGRQVGREASVLFERHLADGRWIGHAEDHVLVVAAGDDLENAVGRVMIDGIDGEVADRAFGSIVALDRPRRRIRRDLPVVAAHQGGAHAV